MLRRLGALETILDTVHPSLDDIYVQTFCVRSAVSISLSRMQAAAQEWAQIHALLRARIEVREDGRYFMKMESDDVRDAVHIREDMSHWTHLAEEEMRRPLDTARGPLWRIHFGRDCTGQEQVIMFTAHHAILDGTNFVTVGLELISILNGREDILPSVDDVTPSIDQLLHHTDVYDGPPPVLDQAWVVPGRKIPPSFNDQHVGEGLTRLLPFSLDPATSTRLLDESRKHGVKMNSTLGCVAALALAELLESSDQPVPEFVQVRTATNMRPYLNIETWHLGCYVTSLYYRAMLKPTTAASIASFWSIAKQMSDDLHRRLDAEVLEASKADSLALRDVARGATRDSDGAHFFLSNLGALTYSPTGGTVVLDDVYFMTSLAENSWLVPLFHATLTVNGRLFWSLIYHSKALQTSLMLDYKELILKLIRMLTEDGHAIP